eukprot:2158424-Pleurochrysis_carterae.AAC.1
MDGRSAASNITLPASVLSQWSGSETAMRIKSMPKQAQLSNSVRTYGVKLKAGDPKNYKTESTRRNAYHV